MSLAPTNGVSGTEWGKILHEGKNVSMINDENKLNSLFMVYVNISVLLKREIH